MFKGVCSTSICSLAHIQFVIYMEFALLLILQEHEKYILMKHFDKDKKTILISNDDLLESVIPQNYLNHVLSEQKKARLI